MKLKNFLIAFTLSSFVISFSSCKKDNNSGTSGELETTFELSGDQAIADNLTEDANDILMETAVKNNFAGNRPASTADVPQTMNILGCATVTISPAQGFPKTVVVDFGTGCTSANGVFRKGKININISDSIRKSGSIAVMTFDNYYVNTYKKEGTIIWTNTSQNGIKSWERKCVDGKIIAADGKYWLHSGTREIVQIAGADTPLDLLDDTYSITGSHTVTNSSGDSRTSTIIEALVKETTCDNIGKGKIQITGPSHISIIDFGDGSCDKIATISIDGYPARTILLR